MKVTWEMVEEFVSKVSQISDIKQFKGVYGPARGGLPLAVWISHKTGLPLLASPFEGALLVDDISDTGATFCKYAGKNFIATMFYHKQSKVVPDFWMYEKTDDWIIFPWEV